MCENTNYEDGYRDNNGYWRSARSHCCNHWLVYLNEDQEAYVHWAGWEPMPDEIKCRRCDRSVFTKETK